MGRILKQLSNVLKKELTSVRILLLGGVDAGTALNLDRLCASLQETQM
jgi:hypothetical protein